MEFNIIIPVYNAGPKIAQTIESILSQDAGQHPAVTFRCLVVDGGSSDDTLAHVRAFDDSRIEIVSEPDNGMYDALAKGLARAAGDVTCYMPAGEVFFPGAFAIVAQVFGKYPDIAWLTGRAVTRNAAGEVTDSLLRHPLRRQFIDCGMYGTRLMAVQQESTFWRTELNAEFDLAALRELKLAGDYFLWRSLARTHELYVVNAHLGAFTIEPGQLSQSTPGGYRREMRQIRRKPTAFERFHALIHRQAIRRRLPGKTAPRLIQYDHDTREWTLTRHR